MGFLVRVLALSVLVGENLWVILTRAGAGLLEKGIDIFRMKGFLSIKGDSRRFVFQGVHMLFNGQPDRSWDDLPRRNQLIFIGRNLDEQGMRQGFKDCLV